MQNVLRVFLTFALIFSSCTQVRNIKNSREPESFYSKVTKAAYGKTVTITATSGESYEGTDVVVASDSTQWILESSGELMIYPTDLIHLVIIKDHFKGFVGGLTVGLLAGIAVAVGAIIVHLNTTEDEAGDMTGAAFLVGGVTLGVLVGSGIGAVIGHKDEYIFNPLKE